MLQAHVYSFQCVLLVPSSHFTPFSKYKKIVNGFNVSPGTEGFLPCSRKNR